MDYYLESLFKPYKLFFRWLYNAYYKKNSESFSNTGINNTYHYTTPYYDWQTPSFIQIRKKKTKRTSPYLETELWEREELLSILKYEPSNRNKAALALFWDLDARNHKITLLKIKHIRLKERYGEGKFLMKQRLELGLYYLHVHFHSYASTLLIEMLKMINDAHKSHVSYYVRKAKEKGYLKEVIRDKIKFSRNHQYYDFQE